MANLSKNVSLDEETLREIEEWANLPTQNRSLSNAIETLCRLGLLEIKKER